MNLNKLMNTILSILRENNVYYDKSLYYHSKRVCYLMNDQISNLNNISLKTNISILVGAFLHDIGKTKLKKEILYKKEQLTDNEKLHLKTHTKRGISILKNTNILNDIEKAFNVKLNKRIIYKIVLNHHEKPNGEGYTKKVHINKILLLICECDIFAALTEPRVYRKDKYDKIEAEKILLKSII